MWLTRATRALQPSRPSIRSAQRWRAPASRSTALPQTHFIRSYQAGIPDNRSVADLLEWEPVDRAHDIVVHGYVRSVRSMKSHRFVALGDGSSLASLQAVLPVVNEDDGLAVGAAVRLRGSWVPSRGSGQSYELHVHGLDILGPGDAKTYPLQKKYQTNEFLRTIPHLRSRIPVNTTLLRLRSACIESLNRFFASRDFVQTHPPIITSSDCEGAGEVFAVGPANEIAPQTSQSTAGENGKAPGSFFRSPKYLTVSTQLHLEALAQSVGNVWTLSPTFRAEKSDTSRHLSEFYMLEAELGFADGLPAVMDLIEDMLRFMVTDLYESRPALELHTRAKHGFTDMASAEDVIKRWDGLMSQQWPRITYTKAIEILQDAETKFDIKPVWGGGLQAEHEKYLAGTVGQGKPIFVTHYPRDIKAFYMSETPSNRSRPTVDCFDLLVPDFCEIAGGSMREHRVKNLLDAMQRVGIDATGSSPVPAQAGSSNKPTSDGSLQPSSVGNLDWYVDLRRWGCPPHGGFGLGFDRLLCYLSGVDSIRDIVAFPRYYGRCDC